MGETRPYDFKGWATRNNVRCKDGRTIRPNAFAECDGKQVPIVWNHRHDDIGNVLGHGILENRKEGVYVYGYLNDSESGKDAKIRIKNGDINALSIYAYGLNETPSKEVMHGTIGEVSLVLAGCNPGAYIDPEMEHSVFIDSDLAHSISGDDDDAVIFTDSALELFHAEEEDKKEEPKEEPKKEEPKKEEKAVAEENKDKTLQDVVDTMNEEQKNAMYALIGLALEEKGKGGDDEGGEDMKHNAFDNDYDAQGSFLSHSDMEQIFRDAKSCGSLKQAVDDYVGEDGVLMHSIDTTGMTGPSQSTASQTYGFRDPDMLFPEYKALQTTPEWISRNMEWVSKVLSGVRHTPFARVKTQFADITEDAARARGYIKGHQKKEEVFTLLKRTTDPQTIYKKQKMDRDDLIDITDFDVVAWIKAEMRVMLNEEIARAILIGDGRLSDSDDKIKEDRVRPIAKDVPLFNITTKVQVAANATEAQIAKATIDAIIRARKDYKGSGNPTFFTTADVVTEMLLMEDTLGHKLYKTTQELATALRVKEIVEVEVLEGQTITNGDDENLPLIGVIVNLSDYNVGANKGGEINLFDDFDIDYNQQKYLLETRISGALVKPFSAMTFLKKQAVAGGQG